MTLSSYTSSKTDHVTYFYRLYLLINLLPPPQNDCNVNGQSYSGNTALHSACGRGQVDTARLLLKNRADSSVKNYHNDTPAMVAKNKKVREKKMNALDLWKRVFSPLCFTPINSFTHV